MRGKNVLVVGVFDLFHRGHVELLVQAAAFGERLFVVVNGDKLTASYKRRPVYCEDDRLAIVSSLKVVSDAVISNAFDVKPYIDLYQIDTIVHGDDWKHEDYLRQICCTEEFVRSRSIRMVYTPYYRGVSTSSIIRSLERIECDSN